MALSIEELRKVSRKNAMQQDGDFENKELAAVPLKELRKISAQSAMRQDLQQAAISQPAASGYRPVQPKPTQEQLSVQSQLGEAIRTRNSNTPVGTAANMAKISELQVQEAQLKVEQNAKRVQEVQQQEQRIGQQLAKLETTRQGLEKLMADYQATGSDVTYQAYMIAYADYNKQMEAYNKEYAAYQKNAKVYDDYNASRLKYEKAYAGYEKNFGKLGTEQEKYIAAHPEIDYMASSVEEIEQRISDLRMGNRQMGAAWKSGAVSDEDYRAYTDKSYAEIKALSDLSKEKKAVAAQTPDGVWGSSAMSFLDRIGLAWDAGITLAHAGNDQMSHKINQTINYTAGSFLKMLGAVTGSENTKERANSLLEASRKSSASVANAMESRDELMAEALYGAGSVDGWIIKQMESIGAMMFDIWLTGGAQQLAGNVMMTGMPKLGMEKQLGGGYALTTTAGRMAPAISTTKTMAIRAAGSGMIEAEEKGYSLSEQILYGIASGSLEYLSETMFGGNPIYDEGSGWLTDAMAKTFKNQKVMKLMYSKGFDILSEGFEEVFVSIAQPIAESAITWAKPQMPTAQEMAEAFAGGLFLSVIGQGASVVATEVSGVGHKNRKAYKDKGKIMQTADAVELLIEEGLAADQRTDAYDLATKLQKKLANGKKLTASEVGKLVYANQDAIDRGLLVDADMDDNAVAPEGALHDAEDGFYAIQTVQTEDGKTEYQPVQVHEDGSTQPVGEQADDLLTAKLIAEQQGLEIRDIGTAENLQQKAEELEQEAVLNEPAQTERLEQEAMQQEVQPVAEVDGTPAGLTLAGDETAQAAPMTAIENEETGLQWAGNQKEVIVNEQTAQTDRDDRSTAGNANYAPVQTGTVGGNGSRSNTARITQDRALARGAAASRYRSAVKNLGVKLVDIREVIPNSVEGYEVQVVPESAYDDEAKRAKEAAADKGLDLVLVVGNIPIMVENKEKSVIGMIDFENGKIYVRADSTKQTVMETVNHELFHDAADRDATLVLRLIDFVKEKYTYEEYSKIVDRYYRDYRDMYPHLEEEKLKEAVWEELLADAYAEYNRYGKETLPGLSEEVQKLIWAGEEKTTTQNRVAVVRFSKSISELTQDDVEQLLEDCVNGIYPDGHYIPIRRNTPEILIEEVKKHSAKDNAVANLPVIMNVEKARQALEEDDGTSYGENRPHSIEIQEMIEIIKKMDDPTYIVFQPKNGRYTEVVSYKDKKQNKVIAVLDFWENKNAVYMSGYEGGSFNLLVTAYKPDDLNNYLKSNQIIYDKKKDSPQRGSGSYLPSHLNGSPFKLSIAAQEMDVKQKFSTASEDTNRRTAESMRDEVLEFMPSDFSPTPHSAPRKSKEESKFAEKLTDEERAVVEQAMKKRGKTEKKSIFDMTIEEMLIPKEGFTSTPAIDKLGVKIAGSVARYRSTEDLKAYVRAATLADKYLRNAVERLKPTDKEIEVAKQLVDGPLETLDLNPETVDIQKVTEIADFYAAKKSYWEDSLSQRKDEIRVMLQRIAQELFADSDKYAPNLKKLPILTKIVMNYKEAERLMRKIFGDEQGQKIYDTVFYPVWINSVEAKRWQGGMLEKVQKFTDKDGKERALTLEEREFAQRIMEGQAVIEELQKLREGTRSKIAKAARALNEGKNLSEVSEEFGLDQGYQQGLAQQYADYLSMVEITQKMDTTIMENAIKVYRQLYNDLYDAINDFLVSHGKPPIGFIKNYAPHFQKHEVQNALLNALSSMGLSQANVSQLPTDIAGRTADYKPIQKWNPHFQQRKGHKTDYDIQVGFERYIDYAAEVFFHTDDIMRVREIVNYYRSQYAGEAISEAIQNAQIDRYKDTEWKVEFLKKQGAIEPLKRTDDMSPKEVNEKYEEYIGGLYKQAEPQNLTKYSNFVTWLDDYANTLAGKQSWMDRGFEAFAGRDALRWSQQVVNAFAKANVAGNLSTVFNQFAQVPILQRDLGIYYELALMDVVTRKTRQEGFSKLSDLLTDRKGIEGLAEMKTGKLVSYLFKPAELTDTLVATIAVRGKYRQLLAQNKGMTPEQALKEADNYGRRVMGSRAKGAKPLAFNNKNFLAAQFNMYQLEALNTLEYMGAEWPKQFRETAKKRGVPYAVAREAVKAMLFMLSTFVINRLAEDNYGGTPAPLDILGWVLTAVSGAYDEDEEEFMQTLLDNILEKSSGERPFGTEPLETPEEGVSGLDWAGAYEDLKYNLADEIPVVRNITQTLGMGDQTGAMAGVGEVFRSLKAGFTTLKDQLLRGEDETGLDWAGAGWKAASEFGSGASIFLSGGRQLKKTARGVTALIRGGMYSGYGENKRLQYPVEATAGNIVRGVMFGPSGFRETDKYYLDGKALSASQTQKAEALEENGVDIQQTYDLYQEYSDINENEDKELLTSIEAKAEKRNAIAEMELNDWQKLEVYLQTLYTGNDKGREKARTKYEALIGENVTWQQLTDLDNDYAALNEDADGDGEADMDSLERGIAKRNTIAMMDLTDQQKLEVYDRYHLDRSADNYGETRKEFEAMLKAGLSWEEITAAHNTYAELNANDELTANQKATEYARWADEQGWNETQKTAIKERYMFWQMIPAEATKYEKFTEQGMSGSEAQRLIELQEKINDMGLAADKDADGKTIAGSKKKKVIQAIGEMIISNEMKDALYFSYGYSESTLDETPWH